MKIYILCIFLILLTSCKGNSSDRKIPISITGQIINNKEADHLNELAVENLNRGKFNESEKLLFEALNLEPDNPTILGNIGLNYDLNGDYEEAIIYYEKSLELSDSTYLISGSNLGLLYYQTKDYYKGLAILDFVVENSSESDLIFASIINRGYIYMAIGDCENAWSDLKRVKSSDPHNADIELEIKRFEKKIKNCGK